MTLVNLKGLVNVNANVQMKKIKKTRLKFFEKSKTLEKRPNGFWPLKARVAKTEYNIEINIKIVEFRIYV